MTSPVHSNVFPDQSSEQLHQAVENVSESLLNSNFAFSQKFEKDSKKCSFSLSSLVASLKVSDNFETVQEVTTSTKDRNCITAPFPSIIMSDEKEHRCQNSGHVGMRILTSVDTNALNRRVEKDQCLGVKFRVSTITPIPRSQRGSKITDIPPQPPADCSIQSGSEKKNSTRLNALMAAHSKMITQSQGALSIDERNEGISLQTQTVSPRIYSIPPPPPVSLEDVTTVNKDDIVNRSGNLYLTAITTGIHVIRSPDLQRPSDLQFGSSLINGSSRNSSSLNVVERETMPANSQSVLKRSSPSLFSTLSNKKLLPRMTFKTKDNVENYPQPPRPAHMTKKIHEICINEQKGKNQTEADGKRFSVSSIFDIRTNDMNDETFVKECSSQGLSSDSSPPFTGEPDNEGNITCDTNLLGTLECTTITSDSGFGIAHDAGSELNDSYFIDKLSLSTLHSPIKTNSREESPSITFDDHTVPESIESYSKFPNHKTFGAQPKTPSILEKKMQQLMRDEEHCHRRPSLYRNLSTIPKGQKFSAKRKKKQKKGRIAINDARDKEDNMCTAFDVPNSDKHLDGYKPMEVSRARRALQFEYTDEIFLGSIPRQASQECVEEQQDESEFDKTSFDALFFKEIPKTLKPITPEKLPQPPTSDDEFDVNALLMVKNPRRHNMLNDNIIPSAFPVADIERKSSFSGRSHFPPPLLHRTYAPLDVSSSSNLVVIGIKQKGSCETSNKLKEIIPPLDNKNVGVNTECGSLLDIYTCPKEESVSTCKTLEKTYEDNILEVAVARPTKWLEMVQEIEKFHEEMLETYARRIIIICRDLFLYHCVDAFMNMDKRRKLDKLELKKRKRSDTKNKFSWITKLFSLKEETNEKHQEYLKEQKRQETYKDDCENTVCPSDDPMVKLCWFVPRTLLYFQRLENELLTTVSKEYTNIENVENCFHSVEN